MVDATGKTKKEVEAEISEAMRARVIDFKEKADTLTLEGVRRALEMDLGLEKFSLDIYKKFIKQCLNECFFGSDDETVSKTAEKTTKEAIQAGQEEISIQHEDLRSTEEINSPALSKMEPADHETEKCQGFESASNLTEDLIRSTMEKRAAYIRASIEKISLADVRRLLEGDLKLQKNSLDAYKGFIRKELDVVLSLEEVVEATNGVTKKDKKGFQSKDRKKMSVPSKISSKDSESLDSDDVLSSDEEISEEKRPKKRPGKKMEASTKVLKRQKKSSSSEKKKPVDLNLDKSSDDEGGNSSENSHSRSSTDERIKKKTEKPTQAYGKQVEHLKSIIKSCGMGVPPSVYKRVKQAPESKREAFLIKELEEILRKEGLSTNPSEKEIKAVKKNKERAKDLEGIDMSNVVSSSRRRTTSSFIPPPKPKIEVESDDEAEDEDGEDDEEDAADGDNDSGESSEGSAEDAEDESD